MNLQARRMRRPKQVNDEGKGNSRLRLTLLAFFVVLIVLVAGCTTDAEGNLVGPIVQAPATAGGTQPAMHRGVPVGFTEEGYPYRGAPNAPVTIYEYSDYECPFCARHVIQTEPALLAGFVESGAVKFVLRDMPLTSIHANAMGAAIAAKCVAEQDIVLFWQMHDKIFRTQKEWAPLGDALPFFAGLAKELGIDTTQYGSCMTNNETQLAKVNESLAEAQALGFTGTPSFRFVNEETGEAFSLTGAQPYDTFNDWIETITAGGTPQGAAQAQPQQQQQGGGGLPFWATAEGLAPDPDRPGFTIAGDMYKGSSDAPIVTVEFGDFQCPYCRSHALTTQPVLDVEFVDRGDVMWVFKHFPIENIHPYAFSASVAAECAAEQETFWQFHHRLFVDLDQWSRPENRRYFMELAAEYELDTEAFAACMAGDSSTLAVQSDMQDGAPFVRGTPTFVVLVGGEGRLIPGALPADQFVATLSQMLAELSSESDDG